MRQLWPARLSVLFLLAAGLGVLAAGSSPAAAAPNDGLLYQFQNNVFLTTESGAGETNLTPGKRVCCAEPSPDGSRIAYQTEGSGRVVEIIASTGGPVLQTVAGFNPVWSADGARLYVKRFTDRLRFFEVTLATGSSVEIPRNIVRWNNAGTEYLYTFAGDLYISSAPVGTDPGIARTLIAAESDSGWWSPNDNRLVYRTLDRALHTVDRSGANRNLLVASTGGGNTPYADWSPDGTRIAYVDADLVNIYTIDPDGTDRRIIRTGFGYNVPRFVGPARPGPDPCAGGDPDPACDQPPITTTVSRAGTASIRGTNADDVLLFCQELGEEGPVPGSYYLLARSVQVPRQEVRHLTDITADVLFLLRGGDNIVEVGPPCEPLEPGVEPVFGEGVTTVPRNLRFQTTTGDDVLVVRGTEIGGDLFASTSRGNDEIELHQVTIGDDFTAQTSVGGDDIIATDLTVADRALLNLSNDFNTVMVERASFGRITIRTGNVPDEIQLLETVLGDRPNISTGGFGDLVVYTPGRAVDPWTGTFTINTSWGLDGISINPGNVLVTSRGTLNINTGSDNDTVSVLIPLESASGRDRLNGGADTSDRLSVISNPVFAAIRNFEIVDQVICPGCPS